MMARTSIALWPRFRERQSALGISSSLTDFRFLVLRVWISGSGSADGDGDGDEIEVAREDGLIFILDSAW